MEFSDKIERQSQDETYVIRTQYSIPDDEPTELVRPLQTTDNLCFYRTIINNVKFNEAIFNKEGYYLTRRIV